MREGEKIIRINIEEQMKSAYIDYSMSVIVSRALPDVRDGFKPVHRRVLYGMSELGITSGKSHKKSARIVGEVLGKYHPHGDQAVYDAMARMAQDFSLRYPLIDGQGNFGSQDGDKPAAMRYTEARMADIAGEMLTDINMNTVDFAENYDGTQEEHRTGRFRAVDAGNRRGRRPSRAGRHQPDQQRHQVHTAGRQGDRQNTGPT